MNLAPPPFLKNIASTVRCGRRLAPCHSRFFRSPCPVHDTHLESMADTAHQPLPVTFPSEDGICAADLYLPLRAGAPREAGPERYPNEPPEEGGTLPPPVVLMAHGIGAERSFGLARFAERFVTRGIAALVFDYRHFGRSTGEPRYLVSPARQLTDYRAALAFVRSDHRVDAHRIALWGTSFSGGHVLAIAAEGPEGVRAVVSQIPFVSGLASTLVYPLRYQLPATLLGAIDALRGLMGLAPLTVAVVRKRGLALLASPDSHDGYLSLVPEGSDWPGRVPARVFLEVLRYHPSRRAPRIPVPTLVIGASNDAICPMGATRRVVRRVPDARLEEYPIGHFDAYHGEWFEKVVTREAEFLEECLDP